MRVSALGLVLSFALLAGTANAGEGVVVLAAGQPAREGLIEALRIQLAGVVPVARAELLVGASVTDRLREAVEAVDRHGALAGVWCEPADVPSQDDCYVVRTRDAGVEVLRVAAGGGAASDRAVALKVREVVESMRAHGSAPPHAAHAAVPPARTDEILGESPLGIDGAFLVEAGGFGAMPAGTAGYQIGGLFGVGGRLALGAWFGEVVGELRPTSKLEATGASGEISASELDLGATLRAGHAWSIVSLGAGIGAGARLVLAEGTSAGGTRSETRRALPVLRLAPELRLSPTDWLQIRAAPVLELTTLRLQLAGGADTLLDLGRARGLAELSLIAAVR